MSHGSVRSSLGPVTTGKLFYDVGKLEHYIMTRNLLTSTSQSTKIPLMFSLISWWLWKAAYKICKTQKHYKKFSSKELYQNIGGQISHNYLKIVGYPECLLPVLVILESFHRIFRMLLRVPPILPVKVLHTCTRASVGFLSCCLGNYLLASQAMSALRVWYPPPRLKMSCKVPFCLLRRVNWLYNVVICTFSSLLVSESEKTQSKPSSEELDVELVSSCCYSSVAREYF